MLNLVEDNNEYVSSSSSSYINESNNNTRNFKPKEAEISVQINNNNININNYGKESLRSPSPRKSQVVQAENQSSPELKKSPTKGNILEKSDSVTNKKGSVFGTPNRAMTIQETTPIKKSTKNVQPVNSNFKSSQKIEKPAAIKNSKADPQKIIKSKKNTL
jgi:hypothetical protein